MASTARRRPSRGRSSSKRRAGGVGVGAARDEEDDRERARRDEPDRARPITERPPTGAAPSRQRATGSTATRTIIQRGSTGARATAACTATTTVRRGAKPEPPRARTRPRSVASARHARTARSDDDVGAEEPAHGGPAESAGIHWSTRPPPRIGHRPHADLEERAERSAPARRARQPRAATSVGLLDAGEHVPETRIAPGSRGCRAAARFMSGVAKTIGGARREPARLAPARRATATRDGRRGATSSRSAGPSTERARAGTRASARAAESAPSCSRRSRRDARDAQRSAERSAGEAQSSSAYASNREEDQRRVAAAFAGRST